MIRLIIYSIEQLEAHCLREAEHATEQGDELLAQADAVAGKPDHEEEHTHCIAEHYEARGRQTAWSHARDSIAAFAKVLREQNAQDER